MNRWKSDIDKQIYSVGAASTKKDYDNDGVSNQTGASKNVTDQLKTVAGLVQAKMKSDGSLNQQDLKTMFAQGGLDMAPNVDKFNELDTNKDGKIEESEVKSDSKVEGEDYDDSLPILAYYGLRWFYAKLLLDWNDYMNIIICRHK